ncbi:helix-turn-helix domain-containing protein [Novosphingobium sp. SG707]|uniref:helix-turn-helix domain-containing protein n=1 Tax=Novosphingobium sp. SG707 TaxID=2586996 RepID=UPI00144686BF|nr:helix-turn-helix domain-containing protein [Novosphingobium sp. SG707]NKJ02660.1 DNA-binding transcriptional regulator YhcF (GntR family) [Novosphingobium sp. SG707]
MLLTLQTPVQPAGSVIEDLRAEGLSFEDIRMGLDLQEAQRRSGAPVLPLRVICGLDAPQRRTNRVGNARILAGTPKPRGRKGGLHITRNEVWANSVQTGTDEEAEFASPLTQRMRARLVIAGKRALKLGRQLACEARAGARALTEQEMKLVCYTPSCQQILIELLDNEKFRKGWCIPAYETIAAWTGLSRSTIYRSLRTLADIGMIEWIRRFIYAHDKEIGARSTQTSNLYRFRLPEWLEKLVGLHTPLPADEEDRRAQAAEEHAAMIATLPPAERRRALPTDVVARAGLVAAGLRLDLRLGVERQARECHDGLPPLIKDYIYKNERSGNGLVGRYAMP